METPEVAVANDTVTVSNIRFGPDEMSVSERWVFTVHRNEITWKIERT